MTFSKYQISNNKGKASQGTASRSNDVGDLGISEDDLPPRGFTVSEWQAKDRNTLRGVFTLTLPSGMIIHGCMLHQKGDSRWIGLPAKPYTKADGSTGYTRIIEFTSWQTSQRFNDEALAAVDAYLEGGAR